MIVINQRIDPDSRTSRGSAWIAEATVNGAVHSAKSRSGAPFELARALIAAATPDQPVRVYTDGIQGSLTYRSLAGIASMTIAESRTVQVAARKWSNPVDVWPKTGGERVPDVAQHPETLQTQNV